MMEFLRVGFKFADKIRATINVNKSYGRPKLSESLNLIAERVQYLMKAHGRHEKHKRRQEITHPVARCHKLT